LFGAVALHSPAHFSHIADARHRAVCNEDRLRRADAGSAYRITRGRSLKIKLAGGYMVPIAFARSYLWSSPCIYQGIDRSKNDLNFQSSANEQEIPDLLHAPPFPPRRGANQRQRSNVAGNLLSIIEFLSQCWGGYHSMIVPTDGSSIEVAGCVCGEDQHWVRRRTKRVSSCARASPLINGMERGRRTGIRPGSSSATIYRYGSLEPGEAIVSRAIGIS